MATERTSMTMLNPTPLSAVSVFCHAVSWLWRASARYTPRGESEKEAEERYGKETGDAGDCAYQQGSGRNPLALKVGRWEGKLCEGADREDGHDGDSPDPRRRLADDGRPQYRPQGEYRGPRDDLREGTEQRD